MSKPKIAAPQVEPVGKVLSEAEMGIGYDRKWGDVIWWNKPPGPALLYASAAAAPPAPIVAPVAWVNRLDTAAPHCVTDLKYCSVAQHDSGAHLKYIPLYAAPPAPAAVPPDDVGLPPEYMLAKLQLVIPLFQEARDALPAISEVARRLNGISSTLADRMDAAGTFSLDDWNHLCAADIQGGITARPGETK